MKLIKNKKGFELELLNVVIPIILVLIFSFVMFTFLDYVGSRAQVYEQSYAKQIALFIDNSKPEMAILLDVSKGLEIANKQGADLSNAFYIKNGRVWVDLGRGGGYSTGYFSNYDINLNLVGNDLSIGITKNNFINNNVLLTNDIIEELKDNNEVTNNKKTGETQDA